MLLFFVLPEVHITAIQLNGSNYPPWAKSVEVYLMAKGQDKYKYVTYVPPDREVPTFVAWKAKDAQICIRLWNSMEPQIIGSLVYLDKAKQVWDRAKEMFFSVGNLQHTYDLH